MQVASVRIGSKTYNSTFTATLDKTNIEWGERSFLDNKSLFAGIMQPLDVPDFLVKDINPNKDNIPNENDYAYFQPSVITGIPSMEFYRYKIVSVEMNYISVKFYNFNKVEIKTADGTITVYEKDVIEKDSNGNIIRIYTQPDFEIKYFI